MALLHSLVDDLRIQNRCHQKEDVPLRSQNLYITRLGIIACTMDLGLYLDYTKVYLL